MSTLSSTFGLGVHALGFSSYQLPFCLSLLPVSTFYPSHENICASLLLILQKMPILLTLNLRENIAIILVEMSHL